MQFLDSNRKNDLHYSGAWSLSEEAAKEVRSFLLDTLQSSFKKVSQSKDEVAFALGIDFYQIDE